MPTASPKPKPLPSEDLVIVELRPPADAGFSGTARLDRATQAALIEELLKRGYTVVEPRG
jgi:hypothetical protein